MFTGIVEEMGEVISLKKEGESITLTLSGPTASQGAQLGDSIAVNGVCLTITEMQENRLKFGVAPETMRRTNLGDLMPGDSVNLERSLPADGRLGGHFVQGHVDGTGTLVNRTEDGDALTITVAAPPELLRYMVPKGYIAVDGTSLTLIDVSETQFTFMLVAYTQQHIVLPNRQIGSRVNLEVDILAKYTEKFIQPSK